MTDKQSKTQPKTAATLTIGQSLWLNALTINIQNAILLTDESMQIIFVNEPFCNFFHIQNTPESFFSKNIMDVLGSIDKSLCNTAELSYKMNELAEKKEAKDNQEFRLNDGKILVAQYLSIQLENNTRGNAWIFADETKTKELIANAQNENDFLQNILNAIPTGVSAMNAAGEFIFANKAEEQNDEVRNWMTGKNIAQYFERLNKQPIDAEKRNYYLAKTLEDKQKTAWQETSEADGKTNNFSKQFIPLTDSEGNLQTVLNVSENIDTLKDAQEKLAESEKRFRDFFHNTKAIICTHDLDGKIIYANPALCALLGFDANEIIGIQIRDYLSEETKEKFDSIYLPEIREGKKSEGLFNVNKKSGETVYLLYQNYVVEEPATMPYVICVAQDISPRIQAEKKLKEAQKQAQELVESKEKFLSNMSHEIRTPMNGILGITSLLQKTILSGEQKFYLDIIEESAQKLLETINQIQEKSVETKHATEEDNSFEHITHPVENLITSVPDSEDNYSTQNISEMKEEPAIVHQQKEPAPAPLMNTLGKLKILLAEDNDINQVLAKNILRHWGFESKTVSDGEEVLAILETEDFDVILMDIQMPHKNGIEVSRDIRQLKDAVKRNIPIIALTAFTIKGDEKKYEAAGMDACLTKPFKEKELFETISKVLEKRKNEPEFYPLITEEEEIVSEAPAQEQKAQAEVIFETEKETSTESEQNEDEAIDNDDEKSSDNIYSDKLYDLTYLRGIQGSSTDLVNKLIEIFIRTVPPATKEMVNSAEKEDWDNVSKLAHKVKSSINTMGIHSLKSDIKYIEETAAQKTDSIRLTSMIIKLNGSVKVASEQLQEELNMQFALLN